MTLTNFIHHTIPTTISVDVQCMDDYPIHNLLAEHYMFSTCDGMICESFTKPPVS